LSKIWYTFWFSFVENRTPGAIGKRTKTMKKLQQKLSRSLVIIVAIAVAVPALFLINPEDPQL
jgi:hypothetical protein